MIEYVLLLLVAISIVGVMATMFRRTLIRLWGYYHNQVSAACPGCPPHPNYRFR
jgi:hypothetical protein